MARILLAAQVMGGRWLFAFALGILLIVPAPLLVATPAPSASGGCDTPTGACPIFEDDAGALAPMPDVKKFEHALLFFWGVGCAHCEKAKSFLERLSREEPKLAIERVEVRRDREGARALSAQGQGAWHQGARHPDVCLQPELHRRLQRGRHRGPGAPHGPRQERELGPRQ